MLERQPVQKVYTTIAKVMGELSKEGIGKNKKNAQQGYQFRGIDDVYNALSVSLSSNGLVILPRINSRTETERESKNGGRMAYVVVDAQFDIVCAEDGSMHSVRTFGEAMDSADKATNKAMSAAYKYMAMQVFCIPTEGQEDADAETHDVKPKATPKGTLKESVKEALGQDAAPYTDPKDKVKSFGLSKEHSDAIKSKLPETVKLTDWVVMRYDAGDRTVADLLTSAVGGTAQ